MEEFHALVLLQNVTRNKMGNKGRKDYSGWVLITWELAADFPMMSRRLSASIASSWETFTIPPAREETERRILDGAVSWTFPKQREEAKRVEWIRGGGESGPEIHDGRFPGRPFFFFEGRILKDTLPLFLRKKREKENSSGVEYTTADQEILFRHAFKMKQKWACIF